MRPWRVVAGLAVGVVVVVAALPVWIGTARLREVQADLAAVLPEGWAAMAVAQAGRPDVLERELREAMGAARLAAADAAGIVLRRVDDRLYAVVPFGFDEEWFDVMAGCWVTVAPVAVVRGPEGRWGLGRVHCLPGRPGGVPRMLGG